MQIVFLSNRPDVLSVTLDQVSHYMPFIDNAVALVPSRQVSRFSVLQPSFPLKLVTDEAVTGLDEPAIHAMDHQSRNYRLRHDLVRTRFVEDEFVMSDDDSRPLRQISIDLFKFENAYYGYYFHELANWRYGSGPFDIGQQNAYQLLTYYGYPQLAYASHMPQIINKAIFLEAGHRFREHSDTLPLCEWAIYFNYAIQHYPQRFHKPRRYRTLCWPESPLSWPKLSQPEGYDFENFTPSLYQGAGPFADISPLIDTDNRRAVTMITAWWQYEIGVLNGYAKERNPVRRLLQLCRRYFLKLTRLPDLEIQARIQDLSAPAIKWTAGRPNTDLGKRGGCTADDISESPSNLSSSRSDQPNQSD